MRMLACGRGFLRARTLWCVSGASFTASDCERTQPIRHANALLPRFSAPVDVDFERLHSSASLWERTRVWAAVTVSATLDKNLSPRSSFPPVLRYFGPARSANLSHSAHWPVASFVQSSLQRSIFPPLLPDMETSSQLSYL